MPRRTKDCNITSAGIYVAVNKLGTSRALLLVSHSAVLAIPFPAFLIFPGYSAAEGALNHVKTISDSGIKEKEKERERSVYAIFSRSAMEEQ